MYPAPCSDNGAYNPDLWFTEHQGRVKKAKKLCKEQCTFIEKCLIYAIKNDIQFGIWGGMTVQERRLFTNRNSHRNGYRYKSNP